MLQSEEENFGADSEGEERVHDHEGGDGKLVVDPDLLLVLLQQLDELLPDLIVVDWVPQPHSDVHGVLQRGLHIGKVRLLPEEHDPLLDPPLLLGGEQHIALDFVAALEPLIVSAAAQLQGLIQLVHAIVKGRSYQIEKEGLSTWDFTEVGESAELTCETKKGDRGVEEGPVRVGEEAHLEMAFVDEGRVAEPVPEILSFEHSWWQELIRVFRRATERSDHGEELWRHHDDLGFLGVLGYHLDVLETFQDHNPLVMVWTKGQV